MKSMFKVLKFEYLTCVRNKAFIITTIFLMACILLVTIIPMIISSFTASDEEPHPGDKLPVICVQSTAYNEELLKARISAEYPGYELKLSDEKTDDIKEKVNSGEYEFAVIINDPLKFTYITANNTITDMQTQTLSVAIKDMYIMSEMGKSGISVTDSAKILSQPVTFETVATGKDQTKDFFVVYFLMIGLFAAIASYGQLVAQSVVSEKNTRTMELLITCARPTDLIFGKVIGSGLAGLTQLTLILMTAALTIGSGKNPMLSSEMLEMINIPISTVLYALLFFILGYFIYSFLLGALASFASKSEDLSGLTTPIIFILMAVYFALVMIMVNDDMSSTAMIVLSYIPFSAPLAMLIRVTLTDIAVWEVVVSVAIQVISVWLLGMLSAAIYKVGVLMYGNPPKLPEIFKMVFRQIKENKKIKN